MLTRLGMGPALPKAVAVEVQGQLSCSYDPRLALLFAIYGEKQWQHHTETRDKASSPVLTPLGPADLQPPHPGPALLCCPGEVQGLLSQMP